jgi:5'-methylthioadenosine phosphorylase
MKYAVIGGSGLENLRLRNALFIPRHGRDHITPPHLINHKAHIELCRSKGCDAILSVASVGIISKYRPRDLIVVRDFISFYLDTPTLFNEEGENFNKVHTDFTTPFPLADRIARVAKGKNLTIRDGGIVAYTRGPRLETKAEIEALKRLGANLIGMTCVPEAILAHESGIAYGCVAVGCNYACGIAKKPLRFDEIASAAQSKQKDVERLFDAIISE